MRYLTLIAIAAAVNACSFGGLSEYPDCRLFGETSISIESKYRQADRQKIAVSNSGRCQVSIEVWSKIGTGPVVYCSADGTDPFLCSEKKSLIDFGSGFVPRSSIDALSPGDKVLTWIRPDNATRVGVRVYVPDEAPGRLMWIDLD